MLINLYHAEEKMTSFYIEAYGCSANVADAEQMAGLLQEARFEKTEHLEEADIVVLVSCTVKSPAVNSFLNRLEEIKQQFPYKVMVIAGCVPQTEPELFGNFSLVGTKQIHNIVSVVEEALNDNIVKALETGEMPPLNLPKVRKNPIVEIIPVSRGCLSACTFCKTKAARGNLQSYPLQEIVAVASKAVREGVKEVWLTSQDTFCYGFDIRTDVTALIKELVQIPGKFKIRIGMGNPLHLRHIKNELFPLLNHPKVFKFLHMPNQAGSDAVLKKMRRGDTNEEYKELVKELRKIVPDVTLATDIIVGFPGETDEHFWETQTTLRVTSPDIVNLSRFWARPGTAAAEMEQVPGEIIKKRSSIITDMFHNISKMQNERWLGWEGEIIIDEKGTHPGQWIGRNDSYKPVIIEGDFRFGEIVNVRIEKATTFDLRGKVRGENETAKGENLPIRRKV